MPRTLLAMAILLMWTAVASAEPPSFQRVVAKAQVPPRAGEVCVASNQLARGLVLPVPGLGFLPVPVEVWDCDVWHTPPNAPAGAPRLRTTVRLITLAE
jgi:hypothetical protein